MREKSVFRKILNFRFERKRKMLDNVYLEYNIGGIAIILILLANNLSMFKCFDIEIIIFTFRLPNFYNSFYRESR